MTDFPAFMKSPLNRIAASSQYTDDIEGYLFDGADGSQVAFWTCTKDRTSREHAHDFDEYVCVIEGKCVAHLEGRTIELNRGDELLIPSGTRQRMSVAAGTRTVHVFGGTRARRACLVD
jgi:quercetin dioxygenase-like cupin family protein